MYVEIYLISSSPKVNFIDTHLCVIYIFIIINALNMARKAKINRKTKETIISVEANLDGRGIYKIDTKIGFLNHMLEQLSKHSLIDLKVKAKGDTHIDLHHTTEDTGIAIGEALKKAAKKFVGIKRYAHRVIPMDETLTRVAIDVSNRPHLIWKVKFNVEKLAEMDTELIQWMKH